MSAIIHTSVKDVPIDNFDSTIMNSKISVLATNKDLIQKITTAFENMPKNLSSMIQSFTTTNGITDYVNTKPDITLQQLIQYIQGVKEGGGGKKQTRKKHTKKKRTVGGAPSTLLPPAQVPDMAMILFMGVAMAFLSGLGTFIKGLIGGPL